MIWPWSKTYQLEGAVSLYSSNLTETLESLHQATAERDAERARRIGAEALAAERKEECQRLREDLAAARATEREARELMAKTLVDVNLRLTSPLQDKPPDMAKIREMNPIGDRPPANRRQQDTRIMIDVLRRMNYPGFGAKPASAPAVAEENPPGEGERPSLNAVG